MRTSKSARLGFTLIELLVVIAIIAILAAILFPVFAQAREKARAISCVSNMKQIGLGILQYEQDYDETFPMNSYEDNLGNEYPWPYVVSAYIKNGDYFGTNGVWMCPDYPAPWEGTPYACNDELCVNGYQPPPFSQNVPGQGGSAPTTSIAAVPTPAQTVLLGETGVNTGEPVGNGFTYGYMTSEEDYWITLGSSNWNGVGTPPSTYPAAEHLDLEGQTASNAANGYGGDCDAAAYGNQDATVNGYGTCGQLPRYRHTNTSNMLYVDGHVKAMVRGQLNWYVNIYIPGTYSTVNTSLPNVY